MEHNYEIAKIAYELYLMRNGAPGDPVSDWVTAERIYAERIGMPGTVPAAEEPAVVVPSLTSRKRKATAKEAPEVKAAVKETKKAAVKTAPAKNVRKETVTPVAKKAARKKAPGASAE